MEMGEYSYFGGKEEDSLTKKGRLALEYVERVRNTPCSGGQSEVLPVTFDHKLWSHYANVAVRVSNLLTKLVIQNNNSMIGVREEFIFDLVRNNVDNRNLLFGSAIAFEEFVFPKYEQFGPYAYKKGFVHSHDLAVNYDYLDPSSEWYAVLRSKNWSHVDVTENAVKYKYNKTAHDVERILKQPMARLEHGHWTLPYYDCGGGYIWMVTYSAPIFGLDPKTQTAIFKGVSTIDIELTQIDINQCDAVDSGAQGDVFRGTHHCQPSTECEPLVGHGFVRGAYICVCRPGFHWPDPMADEKAFNGTIIENAYAYEANGTLDPSMYDVVIFM